VGRRLRYYGVVIIVKWGIRDLKKAFTAKYKDHVKAEDTYHYAILRLSNNGFEFRGVKQNYTIFYFIFCILLKGENLIKKYYLFSFSALKLNSLTITPLLNF